MTPLQKRTAATPRAQRTLMMDARRCMRARDRERILLCERRVAAVTYSFAVDSIMETATITRTPVDLLPRRLAAHAARRTVVGVSQRRR
jgi:hypothetical protein